MSGEKFERSKLVGGTVTPKMIQKEEKTPGGGVSTDATEKTIGELCVVGLNRAVKAQEEKKKAKRKM